MMKILTFTLVTSPIRLKILLLISSGIDFPVSISVDPSSRSTRILSSCDILMINGT